MSHGSEESEDYWPGYVDALTSMVQVLAFVMMLLAMAVFVLSQNVSKSAVEAIAKAAKMDVPPDANVSELTAKVVEMIQKSAQINAASGSPDQAKPPVDAPPAPDASVQPGDSPTKPSAVATMNTMSARSSVQGTPSVASTQKPPEPSSESKFIVLRFADRSFSINASGMESITTFAAENDLATGKLNLIVRAFASAADGALSESRRLAYYRAMAVRRELLARKIPPNNVQIRVFDTPDNDQGKTADVILDNGATK